MSDENSLRVGLVGWGLAGRYLHAPFIRHVDGLELSAVVTSRAIERELFPSATRVSTFEELLDDATLDLIVVASPNRLHVAQARAALEAEKHVVVEKPVAGDPDQMRALIATAGRAGRLLIPFQNRRWDGDFRTLRGLVESQTLGDIHFFDACWTRYQPVPRFRAEWKADPEGMNGPLFDLGPHLIDQALVLFGRPVRVRGKVATIRKHSPVHDWFRLDLDFASGASATLEVDHTDPFGRPRFHVRGSMGAFEKFGLDPQEARLCAGAMPSTDDWGNEEPERWGRLIQPASDGRASERRVPTLPGDYRQFYSAVRAAIVDAAPVPVDPEDIVTQLEVIKAALRSSQSGNAVELEAKHA